MNDDLDALMVKAGDEIRAEHHNAVLRAIRRRELRAGPGVKIRQLDTHRVISYQADPVASVAHAWKPSRAARTDGREGVMFARGLVNGIEPKIGNFKISDKDCLPLAIPGYDDELGDCLIYVEVTLDLQSWRIAKAEMAAYNKRPEAEPFTARKLVATANIDGSITPRAHFDLGFECSGRKPNGTFKSWWRALP